MTKRYNRRSIRLKGYDYSQAGLYFITICCKNQEHFFGCISQQQMYLNDAGKMVESEWTQLPIRFPNIALHEYVVMPNHFHAIIEIVGATLVVAQRPKQNTQHSEQDTQHSEQDTQHSEQDTQQGQQQGIAPMCETLSTKKTLGDMVGAFQSITTVEYIHGVKEYQWKRFSKKLWQRNYWEHIIRNERAYQNISNYIRNNPANWKDDTFFS